VELSFGSFAENITTGGIELASLPVGTLLHVGGAVLEIARIGKQCHEGCAISKTLGDCVMPRRGVFARVIRGGEIDRESVCYYDL
jgi:MOSC domain-containing protein YiiM